jgi:hypothetical protein
MSNDPGTNNDPGISNDPVRAVGSPTARGRRAIVLAAVGTAAVVAALGFAATQRGSDNASPDPSPTSIASVDAEPKLSVTIYEEAHLMGESDHRVVDPPSIHIGGGVLYTDVGIGSGSGSRWRAFKADPAFAMTNNELRARLDAAAVLRDAPDYGMLEFSGASFLISVVDGERVYTHQIFGLGEESFVEGELTEVQLADREKVHSFVKDIRSLVSDAPVTVDEGEFDRLAISAVKRFFAF